ncbi:hypothetical protein [Streptomyces sp. NPDC006739]|uniref:hypothetical protein n=1 Tax=Streptomyces sp. NPDC006739 TaxID=3364763 RepID=UPI003690A367
MVLGWLTPRHLSSSLVIRTVLGLCWDVDAAPVLGSAQVSGRTVGRRLLASRPFTADSMLLFQMAASRDAFLSLFPNILPSEAHDGAPLRGPVVATYSRHDRATGFWHLRAEQQPGIGHSGIGPAPAPMFTTPLLPLDERYPHSALDHRFVNIDASDVYVRGRHLNPAGAHSDHVRAESAHLLLTLADYSR